MMFFWTVLCCALALVSRSYCYTDRTREAEAVGSDVVIACVRLIHDSNVFDPPIDLQLLRKIALVETTDGKNAFTYAYGGGIWGIDRNAFNMIQASNFPENLSASIYSYFNIQWTNVQWDDLNKPLYSALAAGIYLHLFNNSSATNISLWRGLNGDKRVNEDFTLTSVDDSDQIFATVEEIEAEDHIKRQLQTQALHFKVDVSELSADIVIDFSMISPGSYGTVYVSNVFATSSAVYCGSISAKGRLFLNVNSMLPYSSTSGVLYITVTGTSGAEFEVFVESSVSVGDLDYSSNSDEFIIGMFSNHPDVGPLPIQLLLTTTEPDPVVVTIENITTTLVNITITSATPTEIFLSNEYVVSFVNETQKGLLVKAESGKKISVSVSSSHVYSTDSYNALPAIEYAGLEEYTYYGITPYTNVTGLKSRLLVIAKHDNTRITITPSQDAVIFNDTVLIGNQSHVIELNRLETLLIESEQSLTGSKVVSDKPISFLSGHQCAVVPESGTSCDFAIEQFPPTVTYGKQFMLQMLSSRTGGSHFTILTSEKDTNISLWCGLASSNQTLEHTILLDSPGSFKALEIAPDDVTCSLIANQPCLLAVFGTSENNDENDGDPLLIMIPPVEQFVTKATYKKNENLTNTFVGLVVMGSNYPTLKIDGSSLSISDWKEIQAPSLPGDDIIGFATRFEANDSLLHTIEAESDSTNFSVILYGFDFSVGYGQRTGMLLEPIARNSTMKPEIHESIPGQLTCSTGGAPAHAFTWKKDGSSDLITTSTSKYSISSSGFTDSILTIKNPKSDDSGLYTCYIYSYHLPSQGTSASREINIEDPPLPPKPSVSFSSQEFGNTENKSVSVDVSISDVEPMDHVVISWRFTHSDETITDITNNTNPNKYIVSTNSQTLSVLNLQLGEHGIISVAVRSMGVTVFQEASLQIYLAISLVRNDSDFTVNEGDNITFTCRADGIDAPSFKWRKDELLLLNSDKYSILHANESAIRTIEGVKGTSTTIKILSITERDAGNYSCVANNKALVPDSNSFSLQVNPPTNHCMSNPCQNDGTCINLESSYICKCNVSFEGINCESQIAKPIVFVEPFISEPPTNVWVNLYDEAELNCVADGHPKPRIDWYKNGNYYPNNNEDSSRLILESVKLEDRGIYHCKATNINAENKELHYVESSTVILNIGNVIQYSGSVSISSSSSINEDSVDSLFAMINSQLIGKVIDGTTFFKIYPINELNISADTTSYTVDILVTMLIDPSTEWNSTNLLAEISSSFSESSTSTMTAALTTTQERRFDGCRSEQTEIPSQSGNGNLTLVIQWPETSIGGMAVVPCPCGDVSDDTSLVATRYCTGDFTNGGNWEKPVDNRCNFSDLAREICRLTELEVPERLDKLDDLTNTPDLNETEISVSVSILVVTVESVIGNLTLSDGFLNVTDNILSLDESVIQGSAAESNSSARLREALLPLIDGLPIDENADSTIVMKRTFAVAVQKADFENFSESSFSYKTNSSNNESKAVYERTANPDAAVVLPETLFNNKTIIESNRSVISNAVFLNDNAFQVRNNGDFVVVGFIISARVVGYEENAFTNLNPPVKLTIQRKNIASDEEVICVFFDTRADEGRGMWSTEGCYKNVSSDGTVQCFCNHLTSFSILLDLSPDLTGNIHASDALSAISYIGLCISIICLVITITSYLSSKKLRKLELSQLLVNLCVALIGLYITFIIAIYARSDIVFCSIISSALHYFFLVTFVSMAMEAIRLYIKLIIVLKTVHGFVIKSVIISWVLPIFFVLFSFAPDYENYVNKFICRPSGIPYYVGMIAPFVAIYIFNWIVYIMTFVGLIKRSLDKMKAEDGDSSVHRFLRQQLITAVLLSTLLGIGWGIGLLVTEDVASTVGSHILSTIFVLLTAFHGLFVFIMHCLRSQDVRNEWKQWFFGLTRQKMSETRTSEESSMKKLYEKVKPVKKSRKSKVNEIHLTVNSSLTFTNSNTFTSSSANGYEDSTLKFHLKKHEKSEDTPANVLQSPTDEKPLPDIYEYETLDEKTGHDAV